MTRRWIFALPHGAVVAAVVAMLALESTSARSGATSLCISLMNFLALGFGVSAAIGPHTDRASRRAWLLLTGSFVFLMVSGVAFAVGLSDGALTVREALLGFGLRMATVPVLLVGVFTLPRPPLTPRQRQRFLLDTAVVVVGGTMLLWYFIIGAALDRGVTGAAWLSVAFPLCDLLLVFGVIMVLLRGAASAHRPLLFLLGGLAGYLTVDVLSADAMLRTGTGDVRMAGWIDFVVLAASYLVAAAPAAAAAAVWAPATEGGRPARPAVLRSSWLRAARRSGQPVTLLPYLSLVVGYASLAMAEIANGVEQSDALVIGAIMLTCAVALRQVLAMRESHRLVVTDSLTGLANRRQLRDDLERAIERARHTGGDLAVLLIDLDGFKEINDRFGHEAGDTVLVQFASVLSRQVRDSDTAARLGGDEFAVVASDVSADGAGRLAQRVLDAAAVPVEVGGQAMPIRASVGVAVSTAGGTEARELLHRADLAMYDAKRRQTHTWRLYIDSDAERRTAGPVPQIA